jgi:nucleotide-binding universal stress UspA family protein
MYQRILIATDGSRLSRRAVSQGIALAKSFGATVVAFHNKAPYPTIYYGEPVMIPPSTERQFERETQKLAEKYLSEVATQAQKAGVECKGVSASGVSPADAIIRTAKTEKCDLIVMASHGRKGLSRVLLGSETSAVLTHSKIPVLVTR